MAGEFGLSAVKTSAFLGVLVIMCVKGCPVEEREALLKLRASLNDSNAHLKLWEGVDCCRWRGVKCSYGEAKHVHTLDLHGFELSSLIDGHMDSSLFHLRHLRYLDLSFNSFEYVQVPRSLGNAIGGPIPHSIGNLGSLHYLDLSDNNLSGDIPSSKISPEIGQLSNLQVLDLSTNLLSATIPPTIFNLSTVNQVQPQGQVGRNFTLASSYYQDGLELIVRRIDQHYKIPQGHQMLTFEESSFVRNPELCGDPLKRKCSYEVPQSNPRSFKENDERGEERDLEEDVWWSIGVGLSYGVGFAGVVSMLAV
eukprot:Gb_28358 [translate_table: standard]